MVKEIPLIGKHAEHSALVSDEDFELLSRFRWCGHKVKTSRTIYARTSVAGRTVAMHQMLLSEPGLEVDHKDGNGLNNTRENIHLVTHRRNLRLAFERSEMALRRRLEADPEAVREEWRRTHFPATASSST